MKKYDYLVIGQGIAGTWLTRMLLKQGKTVSVLDADSQVSSSKISAGIINPVTGKNFVKTWMAGKILPFAQQAYRNYQVETGGNVYQEIQIYRLFKNQDHRQHWLSKYDEREVGEYVISRDIKLDQNQVDNPFGGFILKGAVVDTLRFLDELRLKWENEGLFQKAKFTFEDMRVESDMVIWKDIMASRIVFAEGWNVKGNPYFSWLPFNPVKGELLTIEAPDLNIELLLNKGIFILPLRNDLYRVGATYTWDNLNERPSAEGKRQLEQALQKLIRVPYRIRNHQAGVRPATHDRRPIIGSHPQLPNVLIFNGMGTKGVSLAPFFADHFATHLVKGLPLDPETDIARFYSAFQAS